MILTIENAIYNTELTSDYCHERRVAWVLNAFVDHVQLFSLIKYMTDKYEITWSI